MPKQILKFFAKLVLLSVWMGVLLNSFLPIQYVIGPAFILGSFLAVLIEILSILEYISQPFKEMMEDDGKEASHD